MVNIKRFIQTIWIFFLFMGCTLLFYYGILWVSDEYNEYHRYEEPEGRSVKVFHYENGLPEENLSFFGRLQIFILEGQ